MYFSDWYTDSMDVYRLTDTVTNGLTKSVRTKVLCSVPCRIYSGAMAQADLQQANASVNVPMKLACDNSVEIHPGDEIIITRGGLIGHSDHLIRAFAGDPDYFYEPYGAVAPQLEHQQIDLKQVERI